MQLPAALSAIMCEFQGQIEMSKVETVNSAGRNFEVDSKDFTVLAT